MKQDSVWMKPTRGQNFEFLLMWGERALSVGHFDGKNAVSVGTSEANDFVLPSGITSLTRWPVAVKKNGHTLIRLPYGSRAQLITAKGIEKTIESNSPGGTVLSLNQAELIQIRLSDSHDLIIRHSEDVDPIDRSKTQTLADLIVGFITMASVLWMTLSPQSRSKNPAPITQEEDESRASVRLVPTPQKIIEPVLEPLETLNEVLDNKTAAAPVKIPSPKTQPKSLRASSLMRLLGSPSQGSNSLIDEVNDRGQVVGVPASEQASQQTRLIPTGDGGSSLDPRNFRLGGNSRARLGGDANGGDLGGRVSVGLPGNGTTGMELEGSVDRNAVRNVIMSNLKIIRSCYAKELKTQSALSGRIKMAWRVEKGGRVSSASPKEISAGMGAVGECLRLNLRSWTFPEPAGETYTVEYPFVFAPLN